MQFAKALLGLGYTFFQQKPPDLSLNAAGQSNQPGIKTLKVRHFELRFLVALRIIKVRALHQMHDISIALGIHDQQDDFVRLDDSSLRFQDIIGIGVSKVELAAKNRLNTFIGGIFWKSLSAKHISGVGHGNGGHALLMQTVHKGRHFHCALRKWIGGMHAQMYKFRLSHRQSIPQAFHIINKFFFRHNENLPLISHKLYQHTG